MESLLEETKDLNYLLPYSNSLYLHVHELMLFSELKFFLLFITAVVVLILITYVNEIIGDNGKRKLSKSTTLLLIKKDDLNLNISFNNDIISFVL